MSTNIVRASWPGGFELRGTDGGPPTLVGHFAVFDQWTTIDSVREGKFLERVAPGAFTRTFTEDRARIRVLFQHGKDPQIGDRPIAALTELREDGRGAWYAATLLDGLPPMIVSGLRSGVYGSSFRFTVTAEDFVSRTRASAYNPDALPERTIRSARVFEMGPVTFPAYAGATAGIRSLTDYF
jgi:HK97 family phage prohead protease